MPATSDPARRAGAARHPGPSAADGPPGTARLLLAALVDPHRIWTREFFEEPLVRVRTPVGDRLVVNDPAMIRHVLVDAADRYGRDPVQRHLLARTTGRSLFAAEGEAWRLQRRALATFFTPRAAGACGDAFRDEAANWAARLGPRDDLELCAAMSGLTVGVIGRTLLGDRLDAPADVVAQEVRAFAEGAGRVGLADLLDLPDWVPRLASLRVRAPADRVRARAALIREGVRAAPTPADALVAALLGAREDGGGGLDDRTIEDNISTLIGAGSDTTALAIAWALYLASGDADVAKRLDAELDALPDTAEALAAAPLARAVVEEAMRLYPPAPAIGRMALVEDRIGEVVVPCGAAVVIAPWTLHRHRRLWEKPDDFLPDRFLPERRAAIAKFAYLPFGAGPRVCLGQHYAMLEATIVFASLWRRLRFAPTGVGPGGLRHNITLQPKNGLHARVAPR